MAMMTETSTAAVASHGGLFSRIAASFVERYTQYAAYRKCIAELSSLSDRDLRDLGLHRSMIRSLAHEEAYRTM